MYAPARPEPLHQRVKFAAGQAEIWWQIADSPAIPGDGRRLLRHAVATLTGRRPEDIALVRDESGRPAMPPGPGLPQVSLSAAHCGSLTVAAVAQGFRVGIDTEALKTPPSPALLLHALHARERAALQAEPEHTRLAAFHTIWTAKEAVAKAIGWPLLRALVDVEVELRPHLTLTRLAKDTHPHGWELCPLVLPGVTETVTLAALSGGSALRPASR